MGDLYFAGRGPGSCYVAELFFDYGYVGVALGSLLYGCIFSQLLEISNDKFFKRAIIFVSINQLLWATRAGFVDFLSFLLAPTTLVLFAFTFLIPKYLVKNRSHYGRNQR